MSLNRFPPEVWGRPLPVTMLRLPGPRFRVDLSTALRLRPYDESLAELAGPRGQRRQRVAALLGLRVEAVDAAFHASLERAGVPARCGLLLFSLDDGDPGLDAAGCLAVLSRCTGAVYGASRSFDMARITAASLPMTLFFPEAWPLVG